MKLDNTTLTIDLKMQDRLRRWIGGNLGNLQPANNLMCVQFGDSDIDYNMSMNQQNIRILSAPYNCENIKHKLAYEGGTNGISGNIVTFRRYINSSGVVQSLYSYPPSTSFTSGTVPPTVLNGLDTQSISFTTTTLEGYILFAQTVLDNYYDSNGLNLRLPEQYNITCLFNGSTTIPANWEVNIDYINGSCLIAKTAGVTIGTSNTGIITFQGINSGMTHTVTFKY